MQWYSSILGGCSSDTHDLPKGPKQAIKLLFQAAALRVLFCVRKALTFCREFPPIIHYLLSQQTPLNREILVS